MARCRHRNSLSDLLDKVGKQVIYVIAEAMTSLRSQQFGPDCNQVIATAITASVDLLLQPGHRYAILWIDEFFRQPARS